MNETRLHRIAHVPENSQLHRLVRHTRGHTLTVFSRPIDFHHRLNGHKTRHTIITRQCKRRRTIIIAPHYNRSRPMTARAARHIQHGQSRLTRHRHKNLQK